MIATEVEALFTRQMQTWPQLAKGVEGLAQATTRSVRVGSSDVLARHIPHRVASTTARVDREAIAKRPCFLCAQNLPSEEEGLPFGDSFTIYCNPFPIVERHLTIAHKQHCAQQIASHFGTMLDLAAALRGYFVIYNGPECGASAPDHLHFQAGSRVPLPIERDTAEQTGIAVRDYSRHVLLFRGGDREALIDKVNRALDALAQVAGRASEPMVNIAVIRKPEEWVTFLFPRGKHRPDAFYTGELTVSPASIDLCGIFVVPLARDFAKITGDAIAAIFREVTLPDDRFVQVVAMLERGR